ncbi:MAG: DUF4214 domain-containing protein [Pyrinomonadaceae bacterium]|nr:DUF4214 domain-containing protein [Pyrinomonadaceae bacterium]
MRFATVVLLITLASLTVLGQTPPSLRIETEVPGLPSELFYGNVKVRPLRLRPGTNTPITINDSDFFVNQQYVDFFSRFPDQSGFDFWVNQIAGCGGNAGCIDGQRANTSGAFFLSIEFQETGFLVYRVHKTSFGTLPLYKDFMPNARAVGKDVVVGPGPWQAKLDANKIAFLDAWVASAGFIAEYPVSMANQAYVDKLIATAGVTSGEVNGSALVTGLNNATETRATVLRKIAESAAVNLKEKNRAFVLMQYLGYLRRDPDQSGFDFWLTKLNNHGGDFHAAEMVKSFIVSGEYKDRF